MKDFFLQFFNPCNLQTLIPVSALDMPQLWQAQVSQSVTDCTYFQTSTLLDEPKFTFSLKRVQEISEIWSKVTVTLPVWDSLLLDKSRFPTEPHYRRGVYIIGRLTDFKQFMLPAAIKFGPFQTEPQHRVCLNLPCQFGSHLVKYKIRRNGLRNNKWSS